MLYRIKFISDEVDGFLREIKIDSEATFLELNSIILQSCGYPDDQMTSFYLCDEEWERQQQITREDMGAGSADEDIFVMDEVRLSEFIEDEEQRMEYVFDPFSDRCFYLDVKEVIPGESLKAPVVLRAKGDAPQQIVDLDLDPLAAITKGAKNIVPVPADEFEEDAIYGGSSFNDDDIDLEGFEISGGRPF